MSFCMYLKNIVSKIDSVIVAMFCGSLSYVFAKKSTLQVANPKMLINVMFWYSDFWMMGFLLIGKNYIKKHFQSDILDFTVYKQNPWLLPVFTFSIFTSNLKAFLLNSYKLSELGAISILTPFVVIIVARIFLKDKIVKKQLYSFLLAGIGFVTYHKLKAPSIFENIFVIYIFFNAISDIITRTVAKKRNAIDGLSVENMACLIVGIFGFSYYHYIGQPLFVFSQLFSLDVFLVSVPTFLHHYFIIKGNQQSKTIILVLICQFSKHGFIYLFDVFFFAKQYELIEIAGLLIMAIAVVLSQKNKKDFKKC